MTGCVGVVGWFRLGASLSIFLRRKHMDTLGAARPIYEKRRVRVVLRLAPQFDRLIAVDFDAIGNSLRFEQGF